MEHQTIGSLGIPVSHRPKWLALRGVPIVEPVFSRDMVGFYYGSREEQECEYCDEKRIDHKIAFNPK